MLTGNFDFQPHGDLSLQILKQLPHEWVDLDGVTATSVDGGWMHHCRYCGGWIEGQAFVVSVNTLGPLSGRKGDQMHCARCGEELAFFGKVS